MPANASRSVVGPGSTDSQAASVCDMAEAAMLTAGFRILRTITNQGTTNKRGRVYRWPTLDKYDTHADLLQMGCSGAGFRIGPALDFDPQQVGFSDGGGALNWASYCGGMTLAWPNGTPTTSVSQTFSTSSFQLSGGAGQSFSVLASEYGVVIEKTDGATTELVYAYRPWHSVRLFRDIRVVTGVAAWPLTFGAPTGQHLTIVCEGLTFNITFPATPMTQYDIAAFITMACGGWLEALVEQTLAGDRIVIRIPGDRPPVANTSSTMPQVSVTYIDPTADQLLLSVLQATGGWSYPTTTSLRRVGSDWMSLGARVGGIIMNDTVPATALITAITATDTLEVDHDIDAEGWAAGDLIRVLPGPNDHGNNDCGHNGQGQAIAQAGGSDETTVTVYDVATPQVFALDDLRGEMLSQLRVGQVVSICNNALAVSLSLNAATAVALGDIVDQGANGAKGIIKAAYPSLGAAMAIVVDTTEVGPQTGGLVTSSEQQGPSWAAGVFNLNGAPSNSITTIRSCSTGGAGSGHNSMGWLQYALVTSVSSVAPMGLDRRTLVGLLIGGAVNNAIRLGPSFRIGVAAKRIMGGGGQFTGTGSSYSGTGSSYGLDGNYDLIRDYQRNVDIAPTAVAAAQEPNYQTGNILLAEMCSRNASGQIKFGGDVIAMLPHMKSVSDRASAIPPLTYGDVLYEDGDTANGRSWVLINRSQENFGAASGSNTRVWTAIGPGGV